MHAIDWLIVLILNGSIIGYGLYLSRGTFSSSEWFLGRRALPWWAIGLSMFATNVDNADIVSISGKTYSTGLHIVTVHAIGSVVGESWRRFTSYRRFTVLVSTPTRNTWKLVSAWRPAS